MRERLWVPLSLSLARPGLEHRLVARARARYRTSSVAAACEIILILGVLTEGTAPRQDDLQAS